MGVEIQMSHLVSTLIYLISVGNDRTGFEGQNLGISNIRGTINYESELAWKMVVSYSIAEFWSTYERHDSPLQFGVCLLALLQKVTE